MTVYAKDPSSEVDYSFDWANWLAADETITSTSWSVEPGAARALVLGADIAAGTVRGKYVSGGEVGCRYQLSCQITTSAGRAGERSVIIRIVER
ncbi:hypothetical protein KFE96_06655 [Kordiimonas sp. SCSIO 12603]|uniref:phage fiber-tail adaptor protein n=1 Tax=Kordiimonas sp. SCSIO 12603 TaxID=2829596 RepID=UPI0021085A58|nr:hypothetical protein [Kordiimonas sp. SCSIO 12603]UTW59981.1 hypothetical protein KFE96_06655 [Kordiimonas sp. SCSIO 12603]